MNKTFTTTINLLNLKYKIVFSNKGLMKGIMSRTDKTGKRFYTEDGRRFWKYAEATKHQIKIENKPRKRWSAE